MRTSEGGRGLQSLRGLPAGRARLAVERIDIALADKRLVLALLRTALAALAVPLVICTVLVAGASPERLGQVPHLVVPLLALSAALAAVAATLVVRALRALFALEERLSLMQRPGGPLSE